MVDKVSNDTGETGQEQVRTGPFYYVALKDGSNVVQGWYQLFTEAKAENFREISKEEYDQLSSWPGARINSDGKLEKYTPPLSFASLQVQAKAALQQVQSQAAMVTAMGEVFGPKTKAYVDQLRGIVEGKDQTITQLPVAPADPTE